MRAETFDTTLVANIRGCKAPGSLIVEIHNARACWNLASDEQNKQHPRRIKARDAGLPKFKDYPIYPKLCNRLMGAGESQNDNSDYLHYDTPGLSGTPPNALHSHLKSSIRTSKQCVG
jgi:hypothetical protein